MMTQAEGCVAAVQPPECHAISRAAGDVLYTPEQVLPLVLHAAAKADSVQSGLCFIRIHSLSLDAHSRLQVATCMMHGLEQGSYHLPSPDFGQNLMVAASAGLSPRMYNVLVEFLLAPFVALALRIFGSIVDKAVLCHPAS
jgi:hypothetical protein